MKGPDSKLCLPISTTDAEMLSSFSTSPTLCCCVLCCHLWNATGQSRSHSILRLRSSLYLGFRIHAFFFFCKTRICQCDSFCINGCWKWMTWNRAHIFASGAVIKPLGRIMQKAQSNEIQTPPPPFWSRAIVQLVSKIKNQMLMDLCTRLPGSCIAFWMHGGKRVKLWNWIKVCNGSLMKILPL